MSILNRACLLVLLGGLPVASAHAAEPSYSILHSFHGEESNPSGSLTSDGRGNLYGATSRGGTSGGGTVFTVRTDGTGFQRLHTFAGGSGDGRDPEASLILDGFGNLYGTTAGGGVSNAGTVFTIRADGSGFQVLHSFMGGANDGQFPFASLTLDGTGTLYGTTLNGGPSSEGIVFKLKKDGTSFQILHSFAGGLGDGQDPQASLLLDESGNLYGMSNRGGQADPSLSGGTVFRIRTDGTGFQVLRAFSGGANDGGTPSGSLISDASGNLYGMTIRGGQSNGGTVFKVGKDGSGFQILHAFAGANEGRLPRASLVLDRAGNLYGMTQGPNGPVEPGGLRTIFKVRTDGTGYQLLHTFIDTRDGAFPSGLLLLDSSDTLYGTMAAGGDSNSGTVFRINTDGSLFQVLFEFAGFMNGGNGPYSPVISDESGYLYGTTAGGGFAYSGTVFKIRSDGSGFQLVHAFSGEANEGFMPQSGLVLDRAGNLYGMTLYGGFGVEGETEGSGGGTVFKVRTDGTGFLILHTFVAGAGDGRFPFHSSLILDAADNLYGTTARGGRQTPASSSRSGSTGRASSSCTPSAAARTTAPCRQVWFWTIPETSMERHSTEALGSSAPFSC